MHYNKIRKMDISNGPGVRVSIFMQGCCFNCKNCFNPETHDFLGGYEFTDAVIDKVLSLCDKSYIVGLSILGGEPMHPKNIDGTLKLAKAFKNRFPDKNIWLWTGYRLEADLKNKEILKYLDVVVDGTYKEELSSPLLRYRGSSNQRVIDVQATLLNKEIVIFKEDLEVCV